MPALPTPKGTDRPALALGSSDARESDPARRRPTNGQPGSWDGWTRWSYNEPEGWNVLPQLELEKAFFR